MHSSQENMVNNLPALGAEPEGEAWLSTTIPMVTMHQLIYPTIDWSVAPLHRNKSTP